MKKAKIIGVAAAALFAISATSIASRTVLADTAPTTIEQVSGSNYFTYNGEKIKNNAIVPVGNGIVIKSGQTAGEIFENIQKYVAFHGTLSEENQKSFDNLNPEAIVRTLYGVKGVNIKGEGTSAIITFDSNTVINEYVRLYGVSQSGSELSAYVPITNQATSTEGPVVNVTYKQDGQEITTPIFQQVFQIPKDSKFSPLSFTDSNGKKVEFAAVQGLNSKKSANISVVENTVDTAKAGSYGIVKLSVTSSNGSKTVVSYKVLVQPEGVQRKSFNNQLYVNTYGINGTTVSSPLENLYQGAPFYVGKDTQIVNGQTYTKISTKSQTEADKNSTRWILTKDLTTPSVEVWDATIMHKALVYDSGGGTKVRKIAAFEKRTLQKQTVEIRGQKYYKIAGAPDFIKAANVDGTKRTLKHNAYVYATSTKRANKVTLKKGTKITTYGGSYKFKNGKRYYRIEGATKTKKMYVKVANFK